MRTWPDSSNMNRDDGNKAAQSRAFAVADQVFIMQAGNIVQAGRPEAVYHQPQTPFVAQFLGTFGDFPPRQKPSSFTIDQVMDQLKSSGQSN